jgi:hypothetical protein
MMRRRLAAGLMRRTCGAWKVGVMAVLLEVWIVDAGDKTVKVVHSFYGYSEREVETYKKEHMGDCGYFRSAETEGRTIEILEHIADEDLPDPAEYQEEEEFLED